MRIGHQVYFPSCFSKSLKTTTASVLMQLQMAVIASSLEREREKARPACLCDRNKARSDWLNPKLIYGWRRKCAFLTYIPTNALMPRQNSSGLILFQVISQENVLKSRRSLHSQHWHCLSECMSRCALFVCVRLCVRLCARLAIHCLKWRLSDLSSSSSCSGRSRIDFLASSQGFKCIGAAVELINCTDQPCFITPVLPGTC